MLVIVHDHYSYDDAMDSNKSNQSSYVSWIGKKSHLIYDNLHANCIGYRQSALSP